MLFLTFLDEWVEWKYLFSRGLCVPFLHVATHGSGHGFLSFSLSLAFSLPLKQKSPTALSRFRLLLFLYTNRQLCKKDEEGVEGGRTKKGGAGREGAWGERERSVGLHSQPADALQPLLMAALLWWWHGVVLMAGRNCSPCHRDSATISTHHATACPTRTSRVCVCARGETPKIKNGVLGFQPGEVSLSRETKMVGLALLFFSLSQPAYPATVAAARGIPWAAASAAAAAAGADTPAAARSACMARWTSGGMRPSPTGASPDPPLPPGEVMSWMDDRRFSFLEALVSRMKYFWAWEATWVGVLETTKWREMDRQSPLPNLARPSRKRRCSSSDQGTPLRGSTPDAGAAAVV